MPYVVQIKSGYSGVLLPDGNTYNAGQSATLTDRQFMNMFLNGQQDLITITADLSEYVDWNTKLVSFDANYDNSYTPTAPFSNPTLGTGGKITGRLKLDGSTVIANSEIFFSPNQSTISRTDMSTNVSTNKFTRGSAHGYSDGMCVIPSSLGTTVLPVSTNPDGSYYVISSTSTDLQLSLTEGGSAIDLTGSNVSGTVHLDAIMANPGLGYYRLVLPYRVVEGGRQAERVVGGGHIFAGGGATGLDAGDVVGVSLHVAPSVSNSVCGIVAGSLNTYNNFAAASYAITNVSTDRAYNANATTLDEVADVLGTVVADLTTANSRQTGSNVGSLWPWTWTYSSSMRVWFMYEAATPVTLLS